MTATEYGGWDTSHGVWQDRGNGWLIQFRPGRQLVVKPLGTKWEYRVQFDDGRFSLGVGLEFDSQEDAANACVGASESTP